MAQKKQAKKNGKAHATRVRMTESEIEKFLKRYAKERDLKGKELDDAVRRCAATRWAALERNAAAHK